MELDLYKKIIDEVTSVSTNFNLWLNGYGESFLNADIFDMKVELMGLYRIMQDWISCIGKVVFILTQMLKLRRTWMN